MTGRRKIAKIVERGTSHHVEWWFAGERRRTRSINKHEGGYSRALRVVAEIEEAGGDIQPDEAVARTFPARDEAVAGDDGPSPFGLWLDLWTSKNRAPESETRRNYANQIARLAQWRDVDVRTWDDDLSQELLETLEDKYAPSTSWITFQRVSGALTLAVEAGVLPALPRYPQGSEFETPGIELDDDQLDAMLHASEPCPDLHDMIALMIETGMRIGEVCAIQPEHLLRRTGTLKVRQTVKHDKSVGKVKNGKNGRRDVVIDPELRSELWTMLLRRADAVPADGFLFHRKSGVGNSPRDLRRSALPTTVRGQWATWVRPLAGRHIVPASVRIHDLRHTAGSMLAADPTIPPLAAAERLGMSLKTYERTYAHTLAVTRNAMGAKMRGWSERSAERASDARRQSIHAI